VHLSGATMEAPVHLSGATMEAAVVELWETRDFASGRWARPHFGRVAGEKSDLSTLPCDSGWEWHGRYVRADMHTHTHTHTHTHKHTLECSCTVRRDSSGVTSCTVLAQVNPHAHRIAARFLRHAHELSELLC
jgi:hypothetical protein